MKTKSKRIKKLVPVAYVDRIRESKENIDSIIANERKKRTPQGRKHISLKEDKLLALGAYLYERKLNFYHQKREFKGLALTYLCRVVGFSSRVQASFYLLVLQKLELVRRVGRPRQKKSSYDYIPIPADITVMSGYRDRNQFVIIEYQFNRYGRRTTENSIVDRLDTLMTESLSLDIDSVPYMKAKEQVCLEKEKEALTEILDEERRIMEAKAAGKRTRKNLKKTDANARREYFAYLEQAYREEAYGVSISETNGRITSIVCSTSSRIRKLIKLDDENTVSLDFSNSQPAMLAHLLKQEISQERLKETEDIRQFILWASSGTFYENVSTALGLSRNEVKASLWMKAAYGKQTLSIIGDEASIVNPHSYQLSRIFPNVIKYLDFLKGTADSHNHAAITLQRLESDLANEIVYKMLNAGIKVLPTYDEFRVKASEETKARQIISLVLTERNIGLRLK
jgi:hypothetical protein